MPNAVNPMYGIFTFSPKNPSLEEFTNFINKLKKSPTKVFNPKNNELMTFIDGSIRFMEVNYKHRSGFHPHLHIILHFKKFAITHFEAQEIFNLLTQKFLKSMDLDQARTHLSVYMATSATLKASALYLTKFKDRRDLSELVSTMETESFLAYLRTCSSLRCLDSAGCFRGIKYSSKEEKRRLKGIYMHYACIPCDNTSPKLYEFKST